MKVFAKPLLECLEGRQLLAGHVLAGHVHVAYDVHSNTVKVDGSSQADQLLISGNLGVGYDITGVGGTTVNGLPTVHINPTGGERANFKVKLGSGNDSVEFNNFAALAVSTGGGSGNDTTTFSNVTAFNGIKVDGGSGNDSTSLDFVDIHDGLSINAGSGNDTVAFGSTASGVTLFSGNADINGGSGHDTLIGKANLHTTMSTQKIKINQFESIT